MIWESYTIKPKLCSCTVCALLRLTLEIYLLWKIWSALQVGPNSQRILKNVCLQSRTWNKTTHLENVFLQRRTKQSMNLEIQFLFKVGQIMSTHLEKCFSSKCVDIDHINILWTFFERQSLMLCSLFYLLKNLKMVITFEH